MKNNSDVKLGVQVYSLTNEFHGREYSFEGLIRKIAELDLGPGVEVVGYQSIREFPRIDNAYAKWFRDLLDECELEPSSLGGMTDVCIHAGRDQSFDQIFENQLAQMEAAAKLGFPLMRVQAFIVGPEIFEKLLPHAERLDVKLAIEIHAPHRVNDPTIMRFRETWDRLDSPYLGFVADFSTSTRAVSPAYLQHLREQGTPEEMIEEALKVWSKGLIGSDERGAFFDRLRKEGYAPKHVSGINRIFGMSGQQPVKDWLEVADQVIHIHSKFFEIDEQGEEPGIPFREILPLFRDAGYKGYVSSEWEGHVFSDSGAFDLLVKQQKLSVDALNNN